MEPTSKVYKVTITHQWKYNSESYKP